MSSTRIKLMDDNLDSSSENEETEGNTNVNYTKVMMPMNQVIHRGRVVDDELDSSSESDSGSVVRNNKPKVSSTYKKSSELKECNSSEGDEDDSSNNDNDKNGSISKTIDSETSKNVENSIPSKELDEDLAGPSCNLNDSDLDEIGEKKYRPKQSKQSKTKKKSKKKAQKSSGNKNNDKNSDDDELEIKSYVPLSSSATSNSSRKNNQNNKKPRQYRREKTDRKVSTQKPPKIPNIPHPGGHVEVKRVSANDAVDILERMKARLAVKSDEEGEGGNKKPAKLAPRIRPNGDREICSVLVIRKKPEFCSDSD